MLLQAANSVVARRDSIRYDRREADSFRSSLSRVCLCKRFSNARETDSFRSSLSRVCLCKRFSNAFQSHWKGKANFHRSTHTLGPVYLHRHPVYHRLRSIWPHALKFIPTSNLITRRIVFAKAIEADAYQHEASSSQTQKDPAISVQAARPDPSNNSDFVRLSNKNVVPLETYASLTISLQKLISRFTDFRTWWIAIHKSYKEDCATWGYGASPIFTVHLGRSGEIEKVSIDEEEIQRRQAADGFLPDADNNGNAEHAQQKLMLARSIAKELELGKRNLNRHSSVVSVVQHPSTYENINSSKKFVKQIDTAVHTVAPVLSWALIIALPLYGIFMVMGAYRLSTKEDEPNTNKKEKMRNLQAQMSSRKEKTSAKQPPLTPSELMQKFFEVREMARKVRVMEGIQTLADSADTKVEVYEPEQSDPPAALIPAVGANIHTEQDEGLGKKTDNYPEEIEVLVDTTDTESDEPAPQDLQTTESSMVVAHVPSRKVKPPIITSLDEAMAILGSKELHSSENLVWASYDGKPQVTHKSYNSSELNVENSLDSSDQDSHLGESNIHQKHIQIETDKFLDIDSGVQAGENKCEVLHKDYNSILYQPQAITVHDTGIKRQSTEDKTLEVRLNDVPGDLPHQTSSNGCLNESQAGSMGGGEQRKQLSLVEYDSTEVLSATRARNLTTQDAVNGSLLSMESDEVVGSGQPLRRGTQKGRHVARFSNTKRWSKQVQRKYDLERDPEIRGLMKEIGSELDSWVTEEEIEETSRFADKIAEGDEGYLQNYSRVRNKIKEERERFGLDAVLEKYKEYQPERSDELWWLDLRYVLCLMVANKEGEGLYGLDMTIDEDEVRGQVARHVIGFEDRKDALNFCRLMELRSSSKFGIADVRPFAPKMLLEVSREEGFQVTVLRAGQIETHVDQTLEEVEEKILEIGRNVYWDKMDSEHSIDIDSILHQRFGL